MIRRESTREGLPVWLIIAQSEHASLASFLACHWAAFPGLSASAREQLLGAILSHDNGWDAWELSPELDPNLGRPYQFTEMPGTTVLPIWTRSIDECESLGPIAGYAASGHFCALLEHHRGHLDAKADQTAAEKFLKAESARRERCRTKWQGKQGDLKELAIAQGYLQSFDAISLWFCCAQRSEALQIRVPIDGGPEYRFEPSAEEPSRITISPWPLLESPVQLTAEANLVPATRYKSRAAYAEAAMEPTLLTWDLVKTP